MHVPKQEISFGLGAMVLSTLGFFYWPLLTLASIPLIILASLDFFKETYFQLKQGKSNVSTIMSLTVIGCVVLGYYFIAALNIVIIKAAV
jgi:cation transport ATPase